jgi:streptogramin lyase
MRVHPLKLLAVLGVFAAFLLSAVSASAAPFVNGTFPLGSEVGANNKIVAGPDGNIWVTVESAIKDVARITPAGQVDEFDVEGIESAVGIAPGPDGNLWVTDVEKAARFAPADPEGTDKSFTVAGIGAEGQVVAGPDGRIWVASNNSVVNFAPADPTGSVKPVAVSGMLSPKDIEVAGGLVVIADNAEARIASFTTGGVQQDFPIASGSQGVAGGPGGQIAYSAPLATPEQVGLINPPTVAPSIPVPGDPFGVAFGPDGAYWVAQFAQGGVTRFTTTGEAQFLGGLPVESPRQIAAGPGGTLWVTLTKNEAKGVVPSVARISGVEAPLAPPPPAVAPQTKIEKGPKKVVKTRKKRAKVKFRFSSSTPGATFQCSLRRLRKGATKAILTFRPCKSPRTYRLRPGRYRFQVRAVSAGLLDPTPAVRKFRIVRIR